MIPFIESEMAIMRARVTKSLHKSGMPISELGQWTSDQVGRESRVRTTRNP